MRGKISFVKDIKVPISIKWSFNGRVLGYYLNSEFFKKKDEKLFFSELKKVLSDTEFKEAVSKIEDNINIRKKMHKST